MSQEDPDPNTDRNAESADPATGDAARSEEDLAYDNWPITDHGETTDRSGSYLGTLGAAGGAGAGAGVLVYDDERETVFEADIDEEERRLVAREGTEREVGDSGGLGEVLEDVGDSLGIDSLSAFAEERLQDDESGAEREISTGVGETVVDPETATFTRSNVSAEADHDLEFSGAYTYRAAEGDVGGDRDDQVFDVERDFVVSFDARDPREEAAVEIEERVLRAEAPREDQRAGDAEPIQEATAVFTIEFDAASDRHAENVVEERCREWHDAHPEPITDSETASVGAGAGSDSGTATGANRDADDDIDPDSRRQ